MRASCTRHPLSACPLAHGRTLKTAARALRNASGHQPEMRCAVPSQLSLVCTHAQEAMQAGDPLHPQARLWSTLPLQLTCCQIHACPRLAAIGSAACSGDMSGHLPCTPPQSLQGCCRKPLQVKHFGLHACAWQVRVTGQQGGSRHDDMDEVSRLLGFRKAPGRQFPCTPPQVAPCCMQPAQLCSFVASCSRVGAYEMTSWMRSRDLTSSG